jgi:hypothetical protein
MTQYVRNVFRPIFAKRLLLVQVARILSIIYLVQAGLGITAGFAYAIWLIYSN